MLNVDNLDLSHLIDEFVEYDSSKRNFHMRILQMRILRFSIDDFASDSIRDFFVTEVNDELSCRDSELNERSSCRDSAEC